MSKENGGGFDNSGFTSSKVDLITINSCDSEENINVSTFII